MFKQKNYYAIWLYLWPDLVAQRKLTMQNCQENKF